MSKFIKALIIINGLIIPMFAGFLLFKYISDLITSGSYGPESIIVGKDLDKARKDSLVLQGISYESPIEVYNSTNFYLPISVMTYEEARKIENTYLDLKRSTTFHTEPNYSDNYFNVLFFDKNYKIIGQLLDRKASISSIFINTGQYEYRDNTIDKSVKNVAYLIGFEDSNKDGKLNSSDDHDLYISDLDGKNLTRVTVQKDVIDYRFMNSNSEIFVRFKDRSKIRDEYKPIKFGLYNIESKIFTELKEVADKLKEIESTLIR